jgi:hypothetical protein
MTLKELQNMIKEEFDAYMGEQEDDVDVSVSDNDVDAEMGDDMDDEGAEDMLRKIYDMLKDKFEAEEEMDDMDDMDDMEDVEADEDMSEADEDMSEEADIEENSTTAAQYQKTGMAAGGPKTAGKDAGYGAVGGKGRTGYDAGSKALQERFQKLANIIK